jgi:hypothetical protein
MRDENEPDQSAHHGGYRDKNYYLLQNIHIFYPFISVMSIYVIGR